MSAFDNINIAGMAEVCQKLGISSGRLRSYGPCPSCNAEKRSSSDRRLPLGTTPNGCGWHCHKCKFSGNLSDLVCLKLQGAVWSELGEEQRKSVIRWAVDNGYEDAKRSNAGKRVVSAGQTIGTKPKQEQTTPVATTGPMRWEPEIWRTHKAALQSPAGKDVLDYLIDQRKLPRDVIQDADLGYLNAHGQDWLVIPLKDQQGTVVNLRFRSVPPAKKTWRLCTGRPMPLFGSETLTSDTDKSITVVEGELDVLAMRAFGFTDTVVSGTTGAGANWPDEWLDILEPYSSFKLFYDNDEAGDAGAEKLASKLGKFRCFRVKDDAMNDVSDMLKVSLTDTYIQALLDNPSPFMDSKLKRAHDYMDQIEKLINNPTTLQGYKTGSTKLDNLIGGIRPGLWVVSGDTGHGKTTWLTWLVWQQASAGVPVLVTSFEQRPIGTVQKLLRAQVGDDFTKVSRQARKDALDQLGQLPIHLYDHYGELKFDDIVEAIRFSARRYDVKIALVDHLGFLVSADQTKDERQAIEHAVRTLATIAVQDNITIMLVCHPNNMSVAQQRRVKITDLKGASAIRQDAHVGIIVHKDDLEGQSFPTSTIYIDKVRSEFGLNGTQCKLAFDPISCVYADDWAATPSGKMNRTVIQP